MTAPYLGSGRTIAMSPSVGSGISGDLAGRITAEWDGDRAEVGSGQTFKPGVLAAAVHHFGTRDGHVPARPFFGVTGEHRDMILDTIREHLAAAARGG